MLQTATTVTLTPHVVILLAPLHVHAMQDILVMVMRVQVRNITIISLNRLSTAICTIKPRTHVFKNGKLLNCDFIILRNFERTLDMRRIKIITVFVFEFQVFVFCFCLFVCLFVFNRGRPQTLLRKELTFLIIITIIITIIIIIINNY